MSCYHLCQINQYLSSMDSLSSPQTTPDASRAIATVSSTVRRILVITDPEGTGGYGSAKQIFPRDIQGFLVDQWDLETLGLGNGLSAPSLTQLTSGRAKSDCLNIFSMLSRYQLILVPNERVRATLCQVMPGLAHHVYAMDCFEQASEESSPDGTLSSSRSQDAVLALWSAFLSHLAG